MKLEPTILDFFKRALRTAQLLKFEDFVIEQDIVRGWNAAKTAIIADPNVPELPFVGVGFNRVGKLIQRMALMDNYTVDTEEKNGFVMGLVIKGDGATMKYKCANPNAIKTPKNVNDRAMWEFELSVVDVEKLAKAQAAMNAQCIQFECDEGSLVIRLTDMERDTYEQPVRTEVQNVSSLNESLDFDKQYDAGMLLTILRNSDRSKDDTISVTIGQGGNMQASVFGIVVNVVPQIKQKVML